MKTFRVFVLGTSGSGKTTLLASMYNKLSVQHPEVGFYLDASDEQRKLLVEKFDELADPVRDWPPGTQRKEFSEWLFTCKHMNGEGHIPLFQFSYVDYAGGTLTDNVEGLVHNPVDEAKQADAVLVLIDGAKVLASMKPEKYGGARRLRRELNHLVPIVMKLKPGPLHFVITKWDVLENEFSLEAVKDHLLSQNRNLESIIDRLNRSHIPARLIPVSSVGRGFAAIDDEGHMVKCGGTPPPEPFQVELPIASTLVDGFTMISRDWLDEEARKKASIMLKIRRNVTRVSKLILHLSSLSSDALPLPPPWNMSWTVARPLLNAMLKRVDKHDRALGRRADLLAAKITDQKSGFEAIMAKHLLLVQRLNRQYPGSDLQTV